jgi:hypothetical protein
MRKTLTPKPPSAKRLEGGVAARTMLSSRTHISAVTGGAAPDFYAYLFLFRCRKYIITLNFDFVNIKIDYKIKFPLDIISRKYYTIVIKGVSICMVYLISSIIEITHDKIKYFDNDNNEQEIDLLECSKNWVEYFNSRDDFITWEGKPAPQIKIENNTCVGQRDWFADKPYFEFFTNPKIRFEIQPKKRFIDHFNKYWRWRRGYHIEFNKISIDLQKAGWTTFDLG